MLIDKFKNIIDVWIQELGNYNLISLQTKPSIVSWSLGQVYIHLIDESNYYIDQIKICLSTDDNKLRQSATDAKAMFFNNDFPDEEIEGAPTHHLIRQPDSREQLMNGLLNLKDAISKVEILMLKSSCTGKTKHPGLGYFNASEWLQFAEMHLRHHLRQKKKIDDYLKKSLLS